MRANSNHARILILDFGSQYTQLIGRAIRECGFFCEIHPFNLSFDRVQKFEPSFIVLSGGPESVTVPGSPRLMFPYSQLTELRHPRTGKGVSVLGICYGMQLMADMNGGKVVGGSSGQYGPGTVRWTNSEIFSAKEQNVWLSHGDHVSVLPQGFTSCASTSTISTVAMVRKSPHRWDVGLQFHPEVHHTDRGKELLKHLIQNIGGCEPTWTPQAILQSLEDSIRSAVGAKDHVLMGLSGGVDSSVAAWLISRVIGERLHCVLIDNGLLRMNEAEQVMKDFRAHHLNVECVNARAEFLKALEGVTEPEQKRKIIGKIFIDKFKDWSKGQTACTFLGQGTLYPDVIESVNTKGPSHTIKTHHNVGGLPKDLPFKLLEPLRELFKDEVRAIGRQMGMPEHLIDRHPFPGPGLAVRVIGEITEQKLETLRRVDAIFIEELRRRGEMARIWQAFAVLTNTMSVGVRGDARAYSPVVALRAVTSRDGMTADWAMFDERFLRETSNRILNEVKEVSRVVLDISSKPPATIEWE